MVSQSSVAWKVLEGKSLKIETSELSREMLEHLDWLGPRKGVDFLKHERSLIWEKYSVSESFISYFRMAKKEIRDNFSRAASGGKRNYDRAFFANGMLHLVSASVEDNNGKEQRSFVVSLFTPSEKGSFCLSAMASITIFNEEVFDNSGVWHAPRRTPQDFDELEMCLDAVALSVFMDIGEVFEEVVNLPRKGYSKKTKAVKSDWKLLNSSYIKTSIRTEGFDVGGHFRLQRCGPGLSKTKLIFISPYEKNGYVRTATKYA